VLPFFRDIARGILVPLLLAVLAAIAVRPALSATPEQLIEAKDRDGDLMLTPEEYYETASGVEESGAGSWFAAADKNGDGLLSVVELRAEIATTADLTYKKPWLERRSRRRFYENDWLVYGLLGADVVILAGLIRAWRRRKSQIVRQAPSE